MAPISTDTVLSSSKGGPAPALTLDYAQLKGPSATPTSREQFVSELRRACSGFGFFYLQNTPLDDPRTKIREKLFTLNSDFFRLPLETRMKIDMENSRHFRGFAKFGDERTMDEIDHRDQVDYGVEVQPLPKGELLAKYPFLNLHGPNQFLPETVLPGHRDQVVNWFTTCMQISYDLTEALELCLGTKPGELMQHLLGQGGLEAEMGRRPYARMKTIRYPLANTIDGINRRSGSTQGVGAHRDGGWITILATSSHSGLQVQSLSGEWLDVPPQPHAVIVNFGQQIERVSKGIVTAATHRVRSLPSSYADGDRYSVAFFSMPALNAIVKPIDNLSSEIIKAWQHAQEERRRATGNDVVVSSVPKGDLWGGDEDPFGFQAWRGITRSHPNVAARWHSEV